MDSHLQPCSCKYWRQARCPPDAAASHVCSSHSQPCSSAYWRQARCPPPAAAEHVCSFHLQPCSCAYWRQARCPPYAASQHVIASHGQPCSCKYWRQARCPPDAAAEHVLASHGQPCLRAHCSSAMDSTTVSMLVRVCLGASSANAVHVCLSMNAYGVLFVQSDSIFRISWGSLSVIDSMGFVSMGLIEVCWEHFSCRSIRMSQIILLIFKP